MVCNLEQWRNKTSTQRLFGEIMKIGDLVSYAGRGDWRDEVGIVLLERTKTCLVRWSNGQESNHSKRWLVKLETLENT